MAKRPAPPPVYYADYLKLDALLSTFHRRRELIGDAAPHPAEDRMTHVTPS